MEVIVSAKTVDEAVALGAKQMGKLLSEVTYEILEEGKKGFLGMMSKEASVKVVAIETVQDKIVYFLNTLVKDMGVEATAKVAKIEENLSESGTIEKDIYVCSLESTFRDDAKSCAIHKAIELLERDPCDVIRCKDCKWFGSVGCAINIVDDSDKPRKYDFCHLNG